MEDMFKLLQFDYNNFNDLVVEGKNTASLNITFSFAKSGYTPLGVVGYMIPNASATLVQAFITGNNLTLASNITGQIGCTFYILYRKNH